MDARLPTLERDRFGFGWKHCGICHTDAATVTGTYPGLKLPRVPGHEVVGRIEALGSGVSRWKSGNALVSALLPGWGVRAVPTW